MFGRWLTRAAQVVLEAVRNHGAALMHAVEGLHGDREVWYRRVLDSHGADVV